MCSQFKWKTQFQSDLITAIARTGNAVAIFWFCFGCSMNSGGYRCIQLLQVTWLSERKVIKNALWHRSASFLYSKWIDNHFFPSHRVTSSQFRLKKRSLKWNAIMVVGTQFHSLLEASTSALWRKLFSITDT